MKAIRKSFTVESSKSYYIIETLSGKEIILVSSDAKIDLTKVNKSDIIIDDDLVKLLDDVM